MKEQKNLLATRGGDLVFLHHAHCMAKPWPLTDSLAVGTGQSWLSWWRDIRPNTSPPCLACKGARFAMQEASTDTFLKQKYFWQFIFGDWFQNLTSIAEFKFNGAYEDVCTARALNEFSVQASSLICWGTVSVNAVLLLYRRLLLKTK